jgi:hypothetical protein
MYTVCKISKTMFGLFKNEEAKAEAERCMALAEAGCDTDIGSCRAIISCVVAQATKEAGKLALPCSLAVINGLNLVTKFATEPGLGWLTIPTMTQCFVEQAAECAAQGG